MSIMLGNPECNPKSWTSYDGSCCTVDKPCGIGEGDCDLDSECIGALVCGKDNCGQEFNPQADCCTGSVLNIT